MENLSNYVKAFQVFKKGRTADWMTILIPKSEFSSELLKSKIEFYKYLGYSIK